jgi:hypothetical protein
MDDILSQGGDRDPNPWPRRLALIGLLLLVVAGGGAYLGLRHHPHAVAARPTPSATSPAAAPTGLAAPARLAGPDGIGGPTMPWAASLRLPTAGTQPTWFSPATGRSEPIEGLPDGGSGYFFTRIGGGWAVQPSPATMADCSNCTGPPLPVWFLAEGARSVTRVGEANQVTPAATAGAVWLTSYPPDADIVSTAGTAREVTLAGAALGSPVRLPPGYVIYQATDRGLLLAPASPQGGATVDKLWDPAHPQASRTFDAVLAASPTEIASLPRCAATCQVQLLDLATGKQTAVTLPAGSGAAGGAFSPDGDFLALQVSSGDDGALAMRLEVAAVADGRLTAVPGTSVSSDALVGFGWPASGDSLVAEFNFAIKTQLTSWHPGATELAVQVIKPGTDESSLIVG